MVLDTLIHNLSNNKLPSSSTALSIYSTYRTGLWTLKERATSLSYGSWIRDWKCIWCCDFLVLVAPPESSVNQTKYHFQVCQFNMSVVSNRQENLLKLSSSIWKLIISVSTLLNSRWRNPTRVHNSLIFTTSALASVSQWKSVWSFIRWLFPLYL